MKNTLFMMLLAGMSLFAACGKDIDLPVLTEDEYPRILGRWPEKIGDQLGSLGAAVGEEFKLNLQFTPSGFCEGTWYVDGVEYVKGTDFTYNADAPQTLHIKLVVTTPKYTTTREAILEFTNK